MILNLNLKNIRKAILPKFYPLLTDQNRFLVLYGSAGSGKSRWAAQDFILRILLGYKDNIKHRLLVLRKTKTSIRETVFEELKRVISKDEGWNIPDEIVTTNKSNFSFEFSNGSQIVTSGLDDVEKLKSLTGITSIWIEEASQITAADMRQINLRLRGIKRTKMQIILTFNPVSVSNWANEFFFLSPTDYIKKNTTIHHSTWRDNHFLDEHSKQQLIDLENQDETMWRIYSEGEWGLLEGRIYNNYEIINNFPDDKYFQDVIYSVDFGFNDPTVVLKIGKKQDDYYCREMLYARKMTNSDLIERLKEIIKSHRNKYIIYADSAEPARIEEINNAGFVCLPAEKDVQDGIDFCKRNKIYISSDSENMIKEIQGYVWKKDKEDNPLDVPVKFLDHAMDSMRYGMYTHWSNPFNSDVLVYDGRLF